VDNSVSTGGRSTPKGVLIAILLTILTLAASCTSQEAAVKDDAPLIGNATSARIATGLENPRGVAAMPDGRLLVVEAGNGSDTTPETGRVSVFDDLNQDGDYDDEGEIKPVISEIASYNTLTEFGTGHDEVGGAGDIVLLDDGRIFFTRDDPSAGYAADGGTRGINVAEVSADFQVIGNLVVRDATMNAVAVDEEADVFYVAESGANRLMAVTIDGTTRTVAEFPQLANGQQPVPAGLSIDPTTGDVLVAMFSGQLGDYFGGVLSFMPGDAKIIRVNPSTGDQADAVTGLTTAVDVAVDELGNVFVVEMTSTWPAARMPRDFDLLDPDAAPDPGGYPRFAGSVTMYPAAGGSSVLLAAGIDSPTNITYTDQTLYVSTGQGTPGRPIIGPTGETEIVGEIYRIDLG